MGSVLWDWEMEQKDVKAYLLWGEGRDEVFPAFSVAAFPVAGRNFCRAVKHSCLRGPGQ